MRSMHLAATTTPRLLGIAFVMGLVALRCAVDGGEPRRVVTLESLDGHKGFGTVFAAHGSTIVTVDYLCASRRRGCFVAVRFGELDANRVVEPLRFATLNLISLDVARDTTVLRLRQAGDETLRFFTRDRARQWTAGQELRLEEHCWAYYAQNVHLEDDVLVVESDSAWCVYRRGELGWRYDTQLRHDGGRAIRISRGRLVELAADGARVLERSPKGWRPIRRIEPPAGVSFDWTRVDVTGRWLITLGSTQPEDSATYQVYVVDLETGELAARLPSQLADERFAERIAASDTTIVALGVHDQRWELSGGTWRPRGVLGEERGGMTWMARGVAIADLIWLGDPASSPSPCGGRVHGFAVAD